MSTRKHPGSTIHSVDGLELDLETVKDLEPREQAGTVRGGRSSSGGSIASGPASGGT